MANPPDTFTDLFQESAPALLAWMRLRLSSSRFDPEDALQDLWLRGSREFTRFDPARGSFRTWIFQVAKHTLLDELRERAAAPLTLRENAAAERGTGPRLHLDSLPEEVTTFTRRLARNEALEKLLDELAALESAERELIVICGLEGRATTDAARLLGISDETSRKQWQRLRQRLGENPRILALIAP